MWKRRTFNADKPHGTCRNCKAPIWFLRNTSKGGGPTYLKLASNGFPHVCFTLEETLHTKVHICQKCSVEIPVGEAVMHLNKVYHESCCKKLKYSTDNVDWRYYQRLKEKLMYLCSCDPEIVLEDAKALEAVKHLYNLLGDVPEVHTFSGNWQDDLQKAL